MRWDTEEFDARKHTRSHRPSAEADPNDNNGRCRHPAVHAEIRRRVEIYRQQVRLRGHITWLPRRESDQ